MNLRIYFSFVFNDWTKGHVTYYYICGMVLILQLVEKKEGAGKKGREEEFFY